MLHWQSVFSFFFLFIGYNTFSTILQFWFYSRGDSSKLSWKIQQEKPESVGDKHWWIPLIASKKKRAGNHWLLATLNLVIASCFAAGLTEASVRYTLPLSPNRGHTRMYWEIQPFGWGYFIMSTIRSFVWQQVVEYYWHRYLAPADISHLKADAPPVVLQDLSQAAPLLQVTGTVRRSLHPPAGGHWLLLHSVESSCPLSHAPALILHLHSGSRHHGSVGSLRDQVLCPWDLQHSGSRYTRLTADDQTCITSSLSAISPFLARTWTSSTGLSPGISLGRGTLEEDQRPTSRSKGNSHTTANAPVMPETIDEVFQLSS